MSLRHSFGTRIWAGPTSPQQPGPAWWSTCSKSSDRLLAPRRPLIRALSLKSLNPCASNLSQHRDCALHTSRGHHAMGISLFWMQPRPWASPLEISPSLREKWATLQAPISTCHCCLHTFTFEITRHIHLIILVSKLSCRDSPSCNFPALLLSVNDHPQSQCYVGLKPQRAELVMSCSIN